jgi:hypothetical protein
LQQLSLRVQDPVLALNLLPTSFAPEVQQVILAFLSPFLKLCVVRPSFLPLFQQAIGLIPPSCAAPLIKCFGVPILILLVPTFQLLFVFYFFTSFPFSFASTFHFVCQLIQFLSEVHQPSSEIYHFATRLTRLNRYVICFQSN